MKMSDTIGEFTKAFCKAQSELTDPKRDAVNPHFKSKYVAIDDLLGAVRPVLNSHGLSIMQVAGGDGSNITITTILMHESGEYIEYEPLTLKAVKTDPQGAGSAITYGRRYSLSAILGVAWDDDDDGNGASYAPNQRQQQQRQSGGDINKGRQAVAQLINELGMDESHTVDLLESEFSKNSINSLTLDELRKLHRILSTMKAKAEPHEVAS